MKTIECYIPGSYENPLTPSGRGRTIAAFHLAQDDTNSLSKDIEMRHDVLNKLMSPRAVSYWLNDKGWLEKGSKVGKVQMLKLTSKGIVTCRNSLAGGADVSTTDDLVATWQDRMKNGNPAYKKESFHSL